MSEPEATGGPFDFKHLEIDEATSRIDLPWIGPKAYFICRPAHESNKPFQSAMLRLSGKRSPLRVLDGNEEDAKQRREDDRKLYPEFIVVNWGGIRRKGASADTEPTIDAKRELIAALPSWIFDRVRVHCMRPENFVREADPNPTTIAPNS